MPPAECRPLARGPRSPLDAEGTQPLLQAPQLICGAAGFLLAGGWERRFALHPGHRDEREPRPCRRGLVRGGHCTSVRRGAPTRSASATAAASAVSNCCHRLPQ